MNRKHWILVTIIHVLIVTGCTTKAPIDYTAYKESRPRSILVLPPLNNTPEVQAPYSVLSYVTRPLAEAGYYVIPVTLVTETFRENGMNNPTEMHSTSAEKLRKIFGADAALCITIQQYGTVYRILSSSTEVGLEAKLIDLKTGALLWSGSVLASDQKNQQQGGLAQVLISAAIDQVIATSFDKSHQVARDATERLLSAGEPNSILYGPRSPRYGTET